MPSLAEGFGLPVAEAMALGTPVMTSGDGALAEVAGGAAVTIDPVDVEAMRMAILRLATDEALCGRLAAAGRVRAASYSPDRFVARLADAYAAMIARHGAGLYPAGGKAGHTGEAD
jgi:glycosyltransferase involved in cell wall biosynthesis